MRWTYFILMLSVANSAMASPDKASIEPSPLQTDEHNLTLNSESWYENELAEKRTILEAFWNERIVKYNKKSVDEFKKYIIQKTFPKSIVWQQKIDKLFSDSISNKIGFDIFFNTLKDLPLRVIRNMNDSEKLTKSALEIIKKVNPEIKPSDLINMKRYMQEKGMSASITLGLADGTLITPDFTGNRQSSYAIHSIGKVFTGMLTLLMVRKGIISEEDLNLPPVKLDESVKKSLPLIVREQLKKVSLHQLMTHTAGLGDYLGGYLTAISEGKSPEMRTPEDFLQFAENKVFPIGEENYSNLGTLLVGLAVKHAYEKKYGPCDYNEILQKYIINEVGMPSFTPWKPENGKFNKADLTAARIAGSPAGGYWMTTEDLAKFGQWIYRKTKTDPELELLMKKYGQEFYNAEDRIVAHSGAIPSSSAFFSVSLKTGAIVAILSDQPGMAFDLHEAVQKNIFSEPPKGAQKK